MADIHSFETPLHHKSSPAEKAPVTDMLTYTAERGQNDLPIEKGQSLSILVHSVDDSDDGTDVGFASAQDIKHVSLPLEILPSAIQSGDEKVQALVKNLAVLLANTPIDESTYRRARPDTASSQSSSSSTYVDNDSQSSGSMTPSIIHRPAPIASRLRERIDNNYGEYYPALPTNSPPRTPVSKAERVDEESSSRLTGSPVVEPLTEIIELYSQQEPVTRDLISPIRPLAIYVPPGREPNIITEEPRTPQSSSLPASPAVVVETPLSSVPIISSTEPRNHWWQISFGRKKSAVQNPIATVEADQPALILPSPPTDVEKVVYAQTRRVPLYAFGTLSFLSVSVGMWFFAISSRMFYWFGVFVGLIQLYLIISFMVGYFGKDFSMENHRKLVEEHSFTSEKAPSVDIYLPCCHEPIEVLENTYKYVAKLQYPNFKVHVLDDGGLDSVKNLAESYGFNYISRDNKPHLKKAGNLRYAFARTDGDFFAIFDADFCPRHDFLDEMLPYMEKYSDIAIVQSPQFFRPCGEQTWVEQGASATQELFYRVVQVNRDRWGAAICVGSNALYRRGALTEVGGTAEIGHSEDVHTGFYALTRGWRLKYIPVPLACGVSPDTPRAFFSQQMRWCSGSTTLLTNSDFWKSDLSIIQKICYMSGMMYYTAAAFMIFLASIPGILMLWLNPGLMMWYNFAYAFPSLIYSVVVFRLWSRQRYNFNCNFVFTIQQYAYLMAIKDRVFGTTASWVPSGDNGAHVKNKKKKGGNNKYRNMRILCAFWMWGCSVALIVGTTLRIIEGYHWWNFVPLLFLDGFNLFISHKFIFCAS